jgi:predicted Zn-dependent protease
MPRWQKISLIVLLLFLIAGTAVYTYARLAAPGPETNYFNRVWRGRLDHYPDVREALGLHDEGDARFDYLGSRYSKIFIEVDAMAGQVPDRAVFDQLSARIKEATGKETSYVFSDLDLSSPDTSSDADLERLENQHRVSYTQGDTAVLYILVVNQDADEALTLGKTLGESGIVIYESALREFIANSPRTLPDYQLSTALHEFGHQLGLDHNDQPGCIMGEHAESDHKAKADPADVITDFCSYEKQELNKEK